MKIDIPTMGNAHASFDLFVLFCSGVRSAYGTDRQTEVA